MISDDCYWGCGKPERQAGYRGVIVASDETDDGKCKCSRDAACGTRALVVGWACSEK
jgi:hypothetical protein